MAQAGSAPSVHRPSTANQGFGGGLGEVSRSCHGPLRSRRGAVGRRLRAGVGGGDRRAPGGEMLAALQGRQVGSGQEGAAEEQDRGPHGVSRCPKNGSLRFA